MLLALLLVLLLPSPRSCHITNYNDHKIGHLIRRTAQCLSYTLAAITVNSTEVSVAVPSPEDDIPHEVESLFIYTLKNLHRSTETVSNVGHVGKNNAVSASNIKNLLAFVSHIVDIPDVVNSYCNGITSNSIVIVLPPKEKISQVDFKAFNFTKIKTIYFAEPTDEYNKPLVIFNLRNKMLVDVGFDCERYEKDPRAESNRMLDHAVDHEITLGIVFVPPYTYPKGIIHLLDLGSEPMYYGIEIAVLQLMNLKFNYSENHELGVCDYNNNTCVGLLADMENDKIDILAGGIGTDTYRNLTRFAYSYPLFNDKIVVVVKNNLNDGLADSLQTRILQKEVWMVYAMVLVITAGLSYWVERRSHPSTSISGICLSWFGVTMGMPTESYEGFVSILLVPTLWISFFVRLVYQTYLITMLLQRNVQSSVNSLEDICRDNYTIFLMSFINDISDGPLKHCPPERFVPCENPLKCLVDSSVTADRKYAAITYLSTYKYELYKYLTPEVENVFHVVDEMINSMPISFLSKTGDPIIKHIDIFGKLIYANGFHDTVVTMAEKINAKELLNAKKAFGLDVNFTPLSLKHVTFVFTLYMGGVCLSLAFFLLEHLWYRTFGYKQMKHNLIKGPVLRRWRARRFRALF